jgi:hypothetical protein
MIISTVSSIPFLEDLLISLSPSNFGRQGRVKERLRVFCHPTFKEKVKLVHLPTKTRKCEILSFFFFLWRKRRISSFSPGVKRILGKLIQGYLDKKRLQYFLLNAWAEFCLGRFEVGIMKGVELMCRIRSLNISL